MSLCIHRSKQPRLLSLSRDCRTLSASPVPPKSEYVPIGNEFMVRRIVAYLTGYNLRTKASVVAALVGVDMSRKACVCCSIGNSGEPAQLLRGANAHASFSTHFVMGHDVEVQITQPQTCQRSITISMKRVNSVQLGWLRFCPALESYFTFARLAPKEVCCGRDKCMPNGGSFSWESMATWDGKPRDALCDLLVVYVCVCVCLDSSPLPIRG
jgi:hypothetical protein